MNGMSLLPENIHEVFARLGFTTYEAKVYAALCACGRLKIRELAKYSDVPQSKMYEVLDSFENKGAVSSQEADRQQPRATAEAGYIIKNEAVSARRTEDIGVCRVDSEYRAVQAPLPYAENCAEK